MKIKNSYSGEGQDIFVSNLFRYLKEEDFTFLDIGCGDTLEKSNSYAFEEIGCKGCCIDRLVAQGRKSTVYQCDVGSQKFDEILSLLPAIHYISLDVDQNSFIALEKILNKATPTRFSVMTFEHDLYSGNDGLKKMSFEALQKSGYLCLFENVCYDKDNGNPFEDWWVNPNTTFSEKSNKVIKDKISRPDKYKNLFYKNILEII